MRCPHEMGDVPGTARPPTAATCEGRTMGYRRVVSVRWHLTGRGDAYRMAARRPPSDLCRGRRVYRDVTPSADTTVWLTSE
jgi:hypothetical protein